MFNVLYPVDIRPDLDKIDIGWSLRKQVKKKRNYYANGVGEIGKNV